MQSIILDTNVVVSALISDSAPSKILFELVLTEKINICISDDIWEEYVEVLAREKFAKFRNFKQNAEIVLKRLKDIGKIYHPEQKIDILKDLSDNKFLELASISFADFLITGNTLDFNITAFEYTQIVSPRE